MWSFFFCAYNKLFEKFRMNLANQECFSWVRVDSEDEIANLLACKYNHRRTRR